MEVLLTGVVEQGFYKHSHRQQLCFFLLELMDAMSPTELFYTSPSTGDKVAHLILKNIFIYVFTMTVTKMTNILFHNQRRSDHNI